MTPSSVLVCSRCSASSRTPDIVTSLGPETFLWVVAGAVGLVLIGGFVLARRWQQRGGRIRPLLPGGRSPLAGAVVFCVLAASLVGGLGRTSAPWWAAPDHGLALIAAIGLAVGYLVMLGVRLLRRQRAELASA